MGWGALVGAAVGAYGSIKGGKEAAKGAAYRPWNVGLGGLGGVEFRGNHLILGEDPMQIQQRNAQWTAQNQAMDSYNRSPTNDMWRSSLYDMGRQADSANGLPTPFFGNQMVFQNQAGQAQQLGGHALSQASTGYGGNNFLGMGTQMLGNYGNQNLGRNMITNFDPNQAGSDYTNLLRQQAQPQEQQATNSLANRLFASGRLGTTGGAGMMGSMQQANQQADIGRQVAGQQFGLQQQLMQQQGYDQALNAEQGRQLGHLGMAGQLSGMGAGLIGQSYQNAGVGMGLGQQADTFGFSRMMQLNDANYMRTQDRFNRGSRQRSSYQKPRQSERYRRIPWSVQ
jgi:hypothetical protein